MKLRCKRVYDPATEDDGFRILVDRLWPRGLSKEKASVDLWLKDVAPSDQLRRWFAHDPAKWSEFRSRYRRELEEQTAALDEIRRHVKSGTVTLVYSARDENHNNAIALSELLSESQQRG